MKVRGHDAAVNAYVRELARHRGTAFPHFELWRGPDGWRWRFVAANGEIVASGEGYRRKLDAAHAIEVLAKYSAAAPVSVQPRVRKGGPR